MEAAGFMAACLGFSTAELVHVLKIVSDTPGSPADRVSGKQVSGFLADRIDVIRGLVDCLSRLSAELAQLSQPPEKLELFLQRWRFTATQQHQLRDLLRRWQLLFPGRSALQSVRGQERARAVIGHLGSELDAAVPDLKAR
jgi:hypothetical protein